MLVHGVHEGVRRGEIIRFIEEEAFHFAPHRIQCRGVLGKSRGSHQRLMGLYGPDQPEDEVCRAVAAEDMLLRHTLG